MIVVDRRRRRLLQIQIKFIPLDIHPLFIVRAADRFWTLRFEQIEKFTTLGRGGVGGAKPGSRGERVGEGSPVPVLPSRS